MLMVHRSLARCQLLNLGQVYLDVCVERDRIGQQLARDGQVRGEFALDAARVEIKRPELDAKLVAENIARQLERRINFRRAFWLNCGGHFTAFHEW